MQLRQPKDSCSTTAVTLNKPRSHRQPTAGWRHLREQGGRVPKKASGKVTAWSSGVSLRDVNSGRSPQSVKCSWNNYLLPLAACHAGSWCCHSDEPPATHWKPQIWPTWRPLSSGTGNCLPARLPVDNQFISQIFIFCVRSLFFAPHVCPAHLLLCFFLLTV